jgi:hypothetical protein
MGRNGEDIFTRLARLCEGGRCADPQPWRMRGTARAGRAAAASGVPRLFGNRVVIFAPLFEKRLH